MWVIHMRLAELWQKAKHTDQNNPLAGLSNREIKDFIHCLDANLNRCWKVSKLHNFSQMAYESGDREWHLSICRELEKVNMEHMV